MMFFARSNRALPFLRLARQSTVHYPYQQQKIPLSRSIFGLTDATTRVVDNSGSIARDVLAAERTFLAWARTGLGFVGAGSALFAAYHRNHHANDKMSLPSPRHQHALEQEQALQYDIVPAVLLLLVNGGYLLVFATSRYLRVIKLLIDQGKFPIDTRGTMTAVVVTAISTLGSMGIVLHAELFHPKAPANDPIARRLSIGQTGRK